MNIEQTLDRLKEADRKIETEFIYLDAEVPDHHMPIRPIPLTIAVLASFGFLYAVLYGVWYLIPVGEYLISGGR